MQSHRQPLGSSPTAKSVMSLVEHVCPERQPCWDGSVVFTSRPYWFVYFLSLGFCASSKTVLQMRVERGHTPLGERTVLRTGTSPLLFGLSGLRPRARSEGKCLGVSFFLHQVRPSVMQKKEVKRRRSTLAVPRRGEWPFQRDLEDSRMKHQTPSCSVDTPCVSLFSCGHCRCLMSEEVQSLFRDVQTLESVRAGLSVTSGFTELAPVDLSDVRKGDGTWVAYDDEDLGDLAYAERSRESGFYAADGASPSRQVIIVTVED